MLLSILKSLFGLKPDEPEPIRDFYTKVVGVSHRNSDGSSRQRALKGCRQGMALQLIPEPNNPYDSDAIAVMTEAGNQIGYIASDTASKLRHYIEKGFRFQVKVKDITGGTREKPTFGCNLVVKIFEK